MEGLDVAVIGAGPYGLSMCAHLISRLRVRTFGQPMKTWRTLMPPDMLLRSHWEETRLSAPGEQGTLQHWSETTAEPRVEPTPLPAFLRYADWFRARFAPDNDPADIQSVERAPRGFRLTTTSGDEVDARRIVVAVGCMPFPRMPEPIAKLEDTRISFAVSERTSFDLEGARVLVLGGGQNGLESAALAHRAGARSVELVVRSQVRWFTPREHWEQRSPLQERLYRIAYPIVGFGPPPINRFVLHPDLFAKLPVPARSALTRRLQRPGGSPWVRGQVEGKVTMTEGRQLASVEPRPDALHVRLDDGSEREVDRLIVCVGYRFDLDRLTFLTDDVRTAIKVQDGWPVLDRAFRSTDPSIQFVGYAAEHRFGPLSRFVAGTSFTAERASSAV